MEMGINPIKHIIEKYSENQLYAVNIRDLHLALRLGVTLDDYIDLIK